MTNTRALAAAVGLVFGLGIAAGAQNNGTPAAPGLSDQEFVKEAAMDGHAEVEIGKLAAMKAATEPVRSLARRIVLEHGQTNGELKDLASQKQITLETNLDAKHQAMIDRFAALSAMAFDRQYVGDMVTAHTDAVALFRRESQRGEDAEIRAWAARTLPMLESHLREVQDLQKELESGRVSVKSTQ